MDPRPTPPNDELLQAWTGGHLTPAEADAVRQALAHDPQARAQAEAWRAQHQALRGLHPELLHTPVPPALAAAAARLQARHDRHHALWRWGGLAASLLLAFGLGWLGHGWSGPGAASPTLAQNPPLRQFARAAAAAHAVYVPEARHPVEVGAAQQEHLVQWLSKRLGRTLRVPDLGAQGYALVGGRLLPGDTGARAQFMYENAGGARVTLYLGGVNAPGAAPDSADTAFRFAEERGGAAFYWVDQGFGYALVGQLAREPLLALATEVHRQLGM